MITHHKVRELLHYDPETGHFAWKMGQGVKVAGSIAGSVTEKGYISINHRGRNYLAHRLAWFWMMGEWPVEEIDHRDTDRANNRWSNLRPATHGENQWNVRQRVDNTSGFKGVTRPKGRTRWHAYINEAGKRKFLGSFATAEDANQAAIAAREAAHGEFARH